MKESETSKVNTLVKDKINITDYAMSLVLFITGDVFSINFLLVGFVDVL